MNTSDQNLEALRDIRSMMERSSRFISLSGWSGVFAGICGLAGAWLAHLKIESFRNNLLADPTLPQERTIFTNRLLLLQTELIKFAVLVFAFACFTAFLFTWRKSKRTGVGIWGSSAQRLLWNTLLPMIAGGMVILRLMELEQYLLIAPVCLIFYGLGLINGSKYTFGEIRYLGYLEVLLGFAGLWMPGYGLLLWATGFGLLHIIYGIAMWWKYDRNEQSDRKSE
jgi:hypothetical protein